jgi:hypothetical protein
MALAFWGVFKSQAEIASQIGHIEGTGTPARHITRLAALGIEVGWSENGTMDELQQAISIGNSLNPSTAFTSALN